MQKASLCGAFSFCRVWTIFSGETAHVLIKSPEMSMRKLNSTLVGIDQGDIVLFSDFEDDGEMWTGEGPRASTTTVSFSEPYDDVPNVTVSVSMIDISNDAFTRFDVQAERITPQGFDIVFRTWGDSQVARARVAWQSIGPVANEDDWDI